jgi:GT2 family glycosyltransferase
MAVRCTVVVPTINPTSRLARKLSALAARTNGLADWVVVVDAPEAPQAWIDSMQAYGFVVLVLGENRGVGAARNAGFRAAHSEFVLPLDDDDEFDPRLIERGLDVFDRAGTDLAFVYSWTRLKGAEIGIVQSPPWDVVQLLKENLCSSCALIRRDAWSAVGGYSEDLKSSLEDWDLWLKFAEAGLHGAVIEEPLFTYHRRKNSTLSMFRDSGQIWGLRRQLVERHRSLYEAHMTDVIVELARDAYGEPGGRLRQLYRYLRIRGRSLFGRGGRR